MKKWLKVILTVTAVSAMLQGMAVHAEEEKSILPNNKMCYNLLLIGTDKRDDSWNGNSDVMILATVNQDTKKLIITSFMRDLYADIPGYGVHKLNYAFAAGGAQTLEETLEDNYKLTIDNYGIVDFSTMGEVIDIIGGVDMDVSDEEAVILNDYLTCMDAAEDHLPGGGSYHLNGNQAVAYMRIRFVGADDYERTERQRTVMANLFEQASLLGKDDMIQMVKNVIPCVEQDLNAVEILKLLASLPETIQYELVENRIPYDGLYHSEGEMLVPDFDETIKKLNETLNQ